MQSKRSWLAAGAFVVISRLVAACGSDASSSPATGVSGAAGMATGGSSGTSAGGAAGAGGGATGGSGSSGGAAGPGGTAGSGGTAGGAGGADAGRLDASTEASDSAPAEGAAGGTADARPPDARSDASGGADASEGGAQPSLKIMTFNIRYGTVPDGANAWANRRDMVYGVFRAQNADVVGTTTGDKIDYVFMGPNERATAAEIVHTQENGRYPSDHFPGTGTIDMLGWR